MLKLMIAMIMVLSGFSLTSILANAGDDSSLYTRFKYIQVEDCYHN